MSDAPFLDRWARRKADALKDAEPDSPVAAVASPTIAAGDGAEAQEQETAPAEPLPDIESLGPDSDYTVFMRDGVPEDLKRLALRRLWRSNPVFANLDGMNDYDENFSLLYKAGEVIQSLYRVGKGMPGLEPDPEAETGDGDETAADGKENPAVTRAAQDEKAVANAAPQHREYADIDGEEEDV